jgi:hypothetical protein
MAEYKAGTHEVSDLDVANSLLEERWELLIFNYKVIITK